MTTEYSGSGDPARSMALLWRSPDNSASTRRSGLSVDRIVAVAIEIADAEGLAALSMRRIAERLGVGTMSLYTYVPGKAELLDVMLDTVYGEAADPAGGEAADPAGGEAADPAGGRDGGAVDSHWRARLERVARADRARYHRHPWLLQVATSRPPLGPNVTAKYDRDLRAIDGIGLTDLEMDSVLTLISGYVHGAVRGAVEAAEAERRTGLTDEQWWHAHQPYLSRVFDPRRWPLAARVGAAAGEEYGGAYHPERAFEFGLGRVLDGIEAFVASRAAGAAG